uniref:Ankyrin repeats (3 copies)/Ankyrin repeat/Ankyrin repeats (Many copies), putative n=1 Tax=Theileria annulata TaxID=5874 RepID=A0A3B0N557_THEAN
MATQTVVSAEISRSGSRDFENPGLSTLFLYYNEGKLTNKTEFSDEEIVNLFSKYSKSFPDNEGVYEVFASLFSSRKLYELSRSCLYTRLYLLKRGSKAYSDSLESLKLVNEKAVENVLILPKVFLDNLFSREYSANFNKWKSKMAYTETLTTSAYESYEENGVSVSVSKTTLRPGELILKSTPISVAPWNIISNFTTDCLTKGEARKYCCFHCLKVVNTWFHSVSEIRIACPKHPCECSFYFCSRDCFLRNGAVHELECEQIPKLQKFSEHFLNPSFVLLVSRTLIKCRLNMTDTCRVSDLHSETKDNNGLLDSILNYEIECLDSRVFQNVIDEIKRFASFLLEELGFDFCLHLTTRELTHFILVVWVNSVPFTSFLNCLSEGEPVMGGTFFSLNTLKFRQSETPNCVVHFDDFGKFTVRSIYEIPEGSELTINTCVDKYTPIFKQLDKFWSVQFFLSPNQSFNSMVGVCSIRCRKCIQSFCYPNYSKFDSEMDNSIAKLGKSEYYWNCENCGKVEPEDLDLLQNKAESIFKEAQKLYLKGEFLIARSVLLDFVSKWSGVLHFGHYLLYNSYLLLSGILMNRPGGNISESLVYIRRAIVAADKFLPKVCHERAYLYDRFGDYLLKLKTHVRIKGAEYDRVKSVIMNSLYNSLWNWVLISGTDSFHSVTAMQKCRSVAFSLNIHTPPIGRRFVVNLPIKYAHLVKFATGYKVLPESDIQMSDIGSMAFTAAQGNEFNDVIVEVLTSVDSLGIRQLGTGLSVLGIVASNLNLNFFTSLLNSYYNFVKRGLDSLVTGNLSREVEIMNILHSIFGPNEIGINLLIILASFTNTIGECGVDINDNNENVMVKQLFGYSERFKKLLTDYKDKVKPENVSKEFYSLLSRQDLLQVNRCTDEILGCQTPLHYASFRGKHCLTEFLLMKGALVNCLNLDGASPLHLAAFNGNYSVAKTLLKHKASVSVRLKSGESPLHLAIYGLHRELVTLLLEHLNLPQCDSDNGEVGPTIWHALVCGIFHLKSNLQSGEKPIDELIERLSKAFDVVKILLKYIELKGSKEVWVWCGYLPSQLLVKIWNRLFENHSLFAFPRRPPSVYVVSKLNGVMEKHLMDLSNPNSEEGVGIYGSLKECKYEVNNYKELNSRNDATFAATRTFQFLVHILKSLEEN